MSCVEYLNQLVNRINAIARSCFDLGTVGELRKLSAEVGAKADELARTKKPPRGS
jgi:hypothetical protein